VNRGRVGTAATDEWAVFHRKTPMRYRVAQALGWMALGASLLAIRFGSMLADPAKASLPHVDVAELGILGVLVSAMVLLYGFVGARLDRL
jgi:hypothetical protein